MSQASSTIVQLSAEQLSTTKHLQRELGYAFSDVNHLLLALTHRSMGGKNNERLEFLGDSLLGAVVAEMLFRAYPDLAEGPLTRLRAALVRKETLSEVARDLDLGNYLVLGPGELKSGGFKRDSILANAVEAIIGAVHLDGGVTASSGLISRLWQNRLATVTERLDDRDPKTRLQEFLQKQGEPLPVYTVDQISGADHARQFTVSCEVTGVDQLFLGTSTSRKSAEQKAADVAYKFLTTHRSAG